MPSAMQPSGPQLPARHDLGEFAHLTSSYPLKGWSFTEMTTAGDGIISGRFVNNLDESNGEVWCRIDEAPEFGRSAFEFAFTYDSRSRRIVEAALNVRSHETAAIRHFEGNQVAYLMTETVQRGVRYLGNSWLERALLSATTPTQALDSSSGVSLKGILGEHPNE
jgi:hypothetical protein